MVCALKMDEKKRLYNVPLLCMDWKTIFMLQQSRILGSPDLRSLNLILSFVTRGKGAALQCYFMHSI